MKCNVPEHAFQKDQFFSAFDDNERIVDPHFYIGDATEGLLFVVQLIRYLLVALTTRVSIVEPILEKIRAKERLSILPHGTVLVVSLARLVCVV